MSASSDRQWFLRELTHRGRARERCSDAAAAVEGERWRVFAVSDGVSSRPHTPFGAHLTARAAVAATLDHLERGGDIAEVPLVVYRRLAPLMEHLTEALGSAEARRALPATLVLLAVGPEVAGAWFAGDGEAGLINASFTEATREGWQLHERVCISSSWSATTIVWRAPESRVVDGIPFHWLGRRLDDLSGPPLETAFIVRGLAEVDGVYVATDGLVDEARQLLRSRPGVTLNVIRSSVSEAVDDVGIAWGGDLAAAILRGVQAAGEEVALDG